jgi:hypothetical protein
MNVLPPPRLAIWLLETAGVDESVVGDLIERYQRGRCPFVWLWRQVAIAVCYRVRAAAAAVVLAIGVVALLPDAWLSVALSSWVLVYAASGLAVVLWSLGSQPTSGLSPHLETQL